jgi:hypothetical protein
MYKKILFVTGISIFAINVEAATRGGPIAQKRAAIQAAANEVEAAEAALAGAPLADQQAARDRAVAAHARASAALAQLPGDAAAQGHYQRAVGAAGRVQARVQAAEAAAALPPVDPRAAARAARIAAQQAAGQARRDARAAARAGDELPTGLPGGSDDDLGPTPAEAAAAEATTKIQGKFRVGRAKAQAERLRAEQAEQAERDRQAAAQAEQDRQAEAAEAARLRAEQAEQAERDRQAAEQADRDRQAAAQAEWDRQAAAADEPDEEITLENAVPIAQDAVERAQTLQRDFSASVDIRTQATKALSALTSTRKAVTAKNLPAAKIGVAAAKAAADGAERIADKARNSKVIRAEETGKENMHMGNSKPDAAEFSFDNPLRGGTGRVKPKTTNTFGTAGGGATTEATPAPDTVSMGIDEVKTRIGIKASRYLSQDNRKDGTVAAARGEISENLEANGNAPIDQSDQELIRQLWDKFHDERGGPRRAIGVPVFYLKSTDAAVIAAKAPRASAPAPRATAEDSIVPPGTPTGPTRKTLSKAMRSPEPASPDAAAPTGDGTETLLSTLEEKAIKLEKKLKDAQNRKPPLQPLRSIAMAKLTQQAKAARDAVNAERQRLGMPSPEVPSGSSAGDATGIPAPGSINRSRTPSVDRETFFRSSSVESLPTGAPDLQQPESPAADAKAAAGTLTPPNGLGTTLTPPSSPTETLTQAQQQQKQQQKAMGLYVSASTLFSKYITNGKQKQTLDEAEKDAQEALKLGLRTQQADLANELLNSIAQVKNGTNPRVTPFGRKLKRLPPEDAAAAGTPAPNSSGSSVAGGADGPSASQAAAVPPAVTKANERLLTAQRTSDDAPKDLDLAKAFLRATLALHDAVNGALEKNFDASLLTQYTDRADSLKKLAEARVNAAPLPPRPGKVNASSNLAGMFAGRTGGGSSTPSGTAAGDAPTTPAADSSNKPAKKSATVTTPDTPSVSPAAGRGAAEDEDGGYDSEGDPILSRGEQKRMKKDGLTKEQVVAQRKPRTGTPASPAAAGGANVDYTGVLERFTEMGYDGSDDVEREEKKETASDLLQKLISKGYTPTEIEKLSHNPQATRQAKGPVPKERVLRSLDTSFSLGNVANPTLRQQNARSTALDQAEAARKASNLEKISASGQGSPSLAAAAAAAATRRQAAAAAPNAVSIDQLLAQRRRDTAGDVRSPFTGMTPRAGAGGSSPEPTPEELAAAAAKREESARLAAERAAERQKLVQELVPLHRARVTPGSNDLQPVTERQLELMRLLKLDFAGVNGLDRSERNAGR